VASLRSRWIVGALVCGLCWPLLGPIGWMLGGTAVGLSLRPELGRSWIGVWLGNAVGVVIATAVVLGVSFAVLGASEAWLALWLAGAFVAGGTLGLCHAVAIDRHRVTPGWFWAGGFAALPVSPFLLVSLATSDVALGALAGAAGGLLYGVATSVPLVRSTFGVRP
jgi:hypothetical protein